MVRLLLILILGIYSITVLAVSVPSPTLIPKLYYRIPKSSKLENKEYLTIKGQDFTILAKRQEEKEDHIYWKTIKIRIKNKEAVDAWPYAIKQLVKALEVDSTPEEPFLGASIFASPIDFQLLNRTRSINAGYRLNTIGSTKHKLSHDFAVRGEASKNETTKEETSNLAFTGNLVYDYAYFYGMWSYFAIASYNRQKTGDIYTVKDQLGLGLVGLEYKFIKDGTYIKKLDLSYVPLFETFSSEQPFKNAFSSEETKSQTTIRHSFRFRIVGEYDGWTISYVLFYRPNYYREYNTIDMQDVKLESTFRIAKNLTEKVDFTFENRYTYDILAYRGGTPRPDNVINSFAVNVNLQF
jgi:hypothetical protein